MMSEQKQWRRKWRIKQSAERVESDKPPEAAVGDGAGAGAGAGADTGAEAVAPAGPPSPMCPAQTMSEQK
jgi:hypothetical protein